MPETPTTYNYYPALSRLITLDDFPEVLGFIKGGLQDLFDKIYYKDFQSSSNISGSGAFYSLDIISRQRVEIELPGTGIFLVLNPDYDDETISSFPIQLQWEWEIMRFVQHFKTNQFSFSVDGFFDLALLIFNVSEYQCLELATNIFVVISTPGVTKFQQLVNDINTLYGSSISIDENSETRYQELIAEIDTIGQNVFPTIFTLYIATTDSQTSKDNLNRFFSTFIPTDVESYIKDLILPKIRATLTLSAAVEFPRNILVPVYPEGTIIDGEDVTYQPIPEPAKAMFTFGEALFYADTRQGLGYNMDLVINTVSPVQIGNTGLILNIQNLKIDLSTTTNFPEADADGRPVDFIGIYVGEGTISFPAFWNHNDGESTGQLKVRNLLAGTGGISGTIGMEAKTAGDPSPLIKANFGGGFSISLDAFDITFQQNAIINSNIHGTMKIPGFKDTTGADAEINIDVWIGTNGEFSVTASEDQGITALRIPNILDVTVKSLSVGRKEGRFYVALSGALEFQDQGGFIGQFIPDKIDIQKLLIWQDGQMEYEGGTLVLPNAITMKIGPVELSVTAVGFGSHEQEHQGIQRQYKFFEFSGGISVNPGNALKLAS